MRAIKTTTISIIAIGLLAGSAVGTVAQDEGSGTGATTFTGRGTFEDFTDGVAGLTPDGLQTNTGAVAQYRYESSDERLNGTVTTTGGWLAGSGEGDDDFLFLRSNTYELTNDGGRWLGEGTAITSGELGVNTETVILVGQDGYAGLTAYLLAQDPDHDGLVEFSGAIFPGAMLEFPEPTAAE